MYQLLLKMITVLHILLIMFILFAPLHNSNYILFLHSIILPFIMVHWYLQDNTCSLTLLEKAIRYKINGDKSISDEDCFTCRIIHPVYDVTKNYKEFNMFLYCITIALWLASSLQLAYKYSNGNIRNIYDLVRD